MPFELVPSVVRVEEREQRAQVGEVEQRKALRVRVVEDEREALLLRLVRAETLREQERPEVGDGRAHRHARADASEREVLDREACRRPLDPELPRPLLGRPVVGTRDRDARDVALHVGGEDRDAGGGQLLRDDLERSCLPGPGCARDEPVPVHRAERDPDRRVGRELALVDAGPELDGGALGRVGLGDRLAEGPRIRLALRHRRGDRSLPGRLGQLT